MKLKTYKYACPRCDSLEVRPVRRFGRLLGNEQQCLMCHCRWEPNQPLRYGRDAVEAAEKLLHAAWREHADAHRCSRKSMNEQGPDCGTWSLLREAAERTARYRRSISEAK